MSEDTYYDRDDRTELDQIRDENLKLKDNLKRIECSFDDVVYLLGHAENEVDRVTVENHKLRNEVIEWDILQKLYEVCLRNKFEFYFNYDGDGDKFNSGISGQGFYESFVNRTGSFKNAIRRAYRHAVLVEAERRPRPIKDKFGDIDLAELIRENTDADGDIIGHRG